MSLPRETAKKQGIYLSQIDRLLQKQIDLYKELDRKIGDILANKYPGKTHIVKEGETLREICNYYYEDTALWKKLGFYNKLQSSILSVGQEIEIPSKEALEESGA